MSTSETPEIPSLEEAYPRDVIVQYIITPYLNNAPEYEPLITQPEFRWYQGANLKEQLHITSGYLGGSLCSCTALPLGIAPVEGIRIFCCFASPSRGGGVRHFHSLLCIFAN